MLETAKQKRPASHRWVIGLFGIMTAGFVIFLADLFRARSGATFGKYWSEILVLLVVAVGLVALLLGGRRRWAYYICSASLAIWCLRSIYTGLWYFYYFITSSPSNVTYLHLLERNKPLADQYHVSIGKQITVPVMLGLWIWLFIRFAIGRPSRSYYGFDDRREGKPQVEPPPHP